MIEKRTPLVGAVRPTDAEQFALVEQIASLVSRRSPCSIDRHDMIQHGYVGLMRARRKFDPSNGIPLTIFARSYILGAIIDVLCEPMDGTRRQIAFEQKSREVLHQMNQELGHPLEEQEVADRMGLPVEQYRKMALSAIARKWASLSEPHPDNENTRSNRR